MDEEQRNAIIEDASRKEFEAFFKDYCREKYGSVVSEYDLQCIGLDRIVAVRTWQAARSQQQSDDSSNNVPVEPSGGLYISTNGQKRGLKKDTSPQQSDVASQQRSDDLLEMALCKAKQSLEFIASITKDEQTELSSDWSDSRHRNLMGLRCYRNQVGQTAKSGLEAIRALIKPESDGK